MNILLVDDDRFVLAALTQNMDWKALGLNDVYTAQSISQAKEVIRNKSVQILITDIDMPQGNGIDLLAWIRENNYDIQTIFLTNYADFSFAQKAVELQSLEYYLKPIELNKLARIIQKAIAKVEESNKAKQAANISNMWEDIKVNISEHFWTGYLKLEAPYTEEELKRNLVKNHLPYKPSDKFIILLFDLYTIKLSKGNNIIDSYQESRIKIGFEASFHRIFQNILSAHDILLELDPASRSFIAIIDSTNKTIDKLPLRLYDNCTRLIQLVNKQYNISLSCYIGKPTSLHEFFGSLKQLQKMKEDIIDCQNKAFILDNYEPTIADYTVPNLKLLDEYLQLEKRDLFITYCKEYLTSLSKSKKLNYTVLASFRIDITQLIFSFLKAKGILAHKLIHGNTNDALLEYSSRSIETMIIYITYIINTALDYVTFSASGKSVASIICEYIDIHFTEDISRNNLAEIVYLDPDYTARLFKKETGISLLNYIITKRVEMAKNLLSNTELSVNLISDKVGYSNYSYFTKLFKKETGFTPVDYRRLNRFS